MGKTLGEIADLVDGRLEGDRSIVVTGVAGLEEAGPEDISFVAHVRFKSAARVSKAACLVVAEDWKEQVAAPALIFVDDPERAIIIIAEAMLPPLPVPDPGVHPASFVAKSAKLGKDVHVGACAVVGDGAVIGDRTRVRAGAVIADEAVLGEECDIHSGVVVRERVRIGNRTIIHANSVIGSDGFGYVEDEGKPKKIPQLGAVEIGDDVEIGACVTVDRARFTATRIRSNVKIDNLVQVAHNVKIGEGTLIVSMVAIAGSVVIGKGCEIAGQAAIQEHVIVGDGAKIAARSGVTKDVKPGSVVSGFPARPHRNQLEAEAFLDKPELVLSRIKKRLCRLEARVKRLESSS